MDNNELNNENPSLDLKDYENEVPDKKNFFSNLLDRFKTNKNPKLLTNGEDTKTHITNRSISSLWSLGNFRASLFTSLDNLRKAISERFSSKEPRNSLAVEVIGESTKEQVEKIVNKAAVQEVKKPPIIPNIKSNNIIKNSKPAQDVRIEIARINTSAIEEESKKITDKKSKMTVVSTNGTIAPEQPSLDARE